MHCRVDESMVHWDRLRKDYWRRKDAKSELGLVVVLNAVMRLAHGLGSEGVVNTGLGVLL